MNSDNTNPNAAFPTNVDLGDAPGGTDALEALFSNEPSVTPTTAPNGETAVAEPVAPQVPAAEEEFLRGAHSVYKTREAALEGLNHKDALIEEMRLRFVALTGEDPVTKKHVGPAPQAPQPTQAQIDSYLKDPKRYWDDATNAASKEDAVGYMQAQTRLMEELFASSGVMPVMADFAKERALNEASRGWAGIKEWVGTPEYNSFLESEPDLKQAIEISESNLGMAPRLPGLYRLAYRAHLGSRATSSPASAPQAAMPQVSPAPQAPRPTATPSSMAPPQPASQADMSTREGRERIMKDLESKVGNYKW